MTGRLTDRLRSLAARFPFVAKTMLLGGSTLIGQAVMLLALPVLTRLFDPLAFGLLGMLMTAVMLLGIPGCLRFDVAIPVPREDEEAMSVLALAVASATAVSALLLLLVGLFPGQLVRLVDAPQMAPYLWMWPAGVWMTACYSAVQLWSMRRGRYQSVARTQMTRAVAGAGSQIGFGAAGCGAGGLLAGFLIFSGAGLIGLLRSMWVHDRAIVGRLSWTSMMAAAKQYRRFPIYSTPESALDSATANLPLILIGAVAGTVEAGLMLLALRACSIPSGLVGSAMSRVFIAEAPQKLEQGVLGPFTLQIMRNLALIAVPAFAALGIASVVLFPYLFGPDWAKAGQMVAMLAPSAALQFIVNPVSGLTLVTQRQRTGLLIQASGFVLVMSGIALGAGLDPANVFAYFAVANVLYYLIFVGIIAMVARAR